MLLIEGDLRKRAGSIDENDGYPVGAGGGVCAGVSARTHWRQV